MMRSSRLRKPDLLTPALRRAVKEALAEGIESGRIDVRFVNGKILYSLSKK